MVKTLEAILAEHPFFRRLESQHLKRLVGCASNARFEAGHLIFREGEEANEFYLIRHGRVALDIAAPNRTVTIQTLGEGEILGWSWLLPPYRWIFDARAVEMTRAIALDGECLRTKCEDDHDLGYELLKQFGDNMMQKLQATRLQLLDLYGAGS